MKKLGINKDEYIKGGSFIVTGGIVLASILFTLYLVAPLFGGRLFISAVVVYASWIGLFLVLKVFLTKLKKGLQPKAYQIMLACLFSIITPLVWFRNHIGIGIIVSMLVIVGFWFAYRADRVQQK
jgi:hypothetical protein